ncbi:MAG: hypothetical protein Q7R98_01860 [Candidatus Jorgensenbacteria bacterium]|nr:hypothetical protein [Candidatus Jorgensenbacteria bacterium]
MALEDLERKLYGPQTGKEDLPVRSRAEENVVSETDAEAETSEDIEPPRNWNATEEVEDADERAKKHSHAMRNIFIVGVAVLGIAAFVGGVLFLSRLSVNKDVAIEIYAPADVSRGVPFEISISVVNQLDSSLMNAVLELRLPQGLLLLTDSGSAKRVITSEDVGIVKGGDLVKRTYKLVPIASENTIQKITVALIYTGNGKGRFESDGVKEVNITKSALTLDIKKPDYVFQNSAAEFTIIYKNTSEADLPDLALTVQYPPSFKFISASTNPDSFNNHWILGTLKAGKDGKLVIRGTFGGTQNSQLIFPVVVSGVFSGNEYKLVEQSVSIAPAPAPVALNIFANGNTNYVAKLGDFIQYSIHYENLSGVALADAVIKATIAGNLADMATINTSGNVNTSAGTVLWNASNMPGLKLIDPGASGDVTFSVRLKSNFPSGSMAGKNYAVRIDSLFDSPSVPYYLQTSRTTAAASLETRVGGGILIDAQVLHYDVLSGIPNNGAFPPKVGMPTQYTAHWILRNFSTDIKNVNVTATLASGVTWTGVTKSEPGSSISYNERTQEVTWTLARIPAMRGVTSEPVEAIFQIEATPDATNVGRFETLVNRTAVAATDEFTGAAITASDVSLTTELIDDKTVGRNAGIVIP